VLRLRVPKEAGKYVQILHIKKVKAQSKTDKSNFYVVQNLVISLAKNKNESTLPVDFLMGIRNFLFQEWANA